VYAGERPGSSAQVLDRYRRCLAGGTRPTFESVGVDSDEIIENAATGTVPVRSAGRDRHRKTDATNAMTHLAPPTGPLGDGVVTLRLPSKVAGDVDAVDHYAATEDQLDGSWLPLIPYAPAERSVGDWLEGWAGRPHHNSALLVVTIPDERRFIGVVGFGDPDDGIVEMIYGMAPSWRGRGLASRAARLGASWALSLPSVDAVSYE